MDPTLSIPQGKKRHPKNQNRSSHERHGGGEGIDMKEPKKGNEESNKPKTSVEHIFRSTPLGDVYYCRTVEAKRRFPLPPPSSSLVRLDDQDSKFENQSHEAPIKGVQKKNNKKIKPMYCPLFRSIDEELEEEEEEDNNEDDNEEDKETSDNKYKVQILFRNATNQKLKLCWVNTKGKLCHFYDLLPSKTILTDSSLFNRMDTDDRNEEEDDHGTTFQVQGYHLEHTYVGHAFVFLSPCEDTATDKSSYPKDRTFQIVAGYRPTCVSTKQQKVDSTDQAENENEDDKNDRTKEEEDEEEEERPIHMVTISRQKVESIIKTTHVTKIQTLSKQLAQNFRQRFQNLYKKSHAKTNQGDNKEDKFKHTTPDPSLGAVSQSTNRSSTSKRNQPKAKANMDDAKTHQKLVTKEIQWEYQLWVEEAFMDTTPYDTTKKVYIDMEWGGWPIKCEQGLFPDDKEDPDPTMTMTASMKKLHDIRRRICMDLEAASSKLPPHARLLLKKSTPIYINKTQYYGCKLCPTTNEANLCYHPDAAWLQENGLSVEKCGSVEMSRIDEYLDDVDLWYGAGGVLIHELSHAWHHKFVENGFQNEVIRSCYRQAMKEGLYNCVKCHKESSSSSSSKSKYVECKAYACQDPMEYFAELSTAFLGGVGQEKDLEFNKWYPFNRKQIKEHDPRAYYMLQQMWGVKDEDENEDKNDSAPPM